MKSRRKKPREFRKGEHCFTTDEVIAITGIEWSSAYGRLNRWLKNDNYSVEKLLEPRHEEHANSGEEAGNAEFRALSDEDRASPRDLNWGGGTWEKEFYRGKYGTKKGKRS
jgi:hypothetical protein